MNIKETISVLNQMQDDGIIGPYALGGAVAANLYLEPTDTADLDVFVALEPAAGQTIVTLQPIYSYLRSLGYDVSDKGDVVVSGWPVQFLPVGGDDLLTEALESRVKKDIDGTPLYAFTPEHLMAIALRLGRPKDKARLLLFLESSSSAEPKQRFDDATLDKILNRHSLTDRWITFKNKMAE